MITVKFGKNFEVTFSGERWKCDDEVVRKMLNNTFDTDEVSISDTYRTSKYDAGVVGLDGVALDAIAHLKPEIVEYEADVIPKEEEGVVI